MTADSLPDTPEQIAAVMDGQMRNYGVSGRWAFLPSPRVQNHAAFLHHSPSAPLACAWFAGGLEGRSDICIFSSEFNEETMSWGMARQLSDDPDRSEQNPVLFDAAEGQRMLLHTAQEGGDQDRCVVRLRELGRPPVTLPLPKGTFVRARPIFRQDGAWLLPLFHCVHSPGARWTGRNDYASVAISTDQGKTWRLADVPDSTGCVHMTIVPLDEANMVAFFRRRQADFVYRTESSDGGETWSPPHPTNMPNNNSSIAAARLQDGRIALVCNPTNAEMSAARRTSLYDELGDDDRPEASGGCTPIWGVPRAPLVLAFSTDAGKSFETALTLADGPGTCLSNDSTDGQNKELSYPALSQSATGDLDVCFTYHRRAIAHVRVSAQDIGATA